MQPNPTHVPLAHLSECLYVWIFADHRGKICKAEMGLAPLPTCANAFKSVAWVHVQGSPHLFSIRGAESLE